MSLHRFYIPPAVWNLEDLRLDEEESHHCLDVLRLNAGDRAIVFNGCGVEVTAEIAVAGKKSVTLRKQSVLKTPPPPARLSLCQAIPKGKNMDFIIEKATELGAAEIVPLISERTVVRLDAEEAAKKQEKWQRAAVEACKQCGQNWLPIVRSPLTVERFLAFKPQADLMLIAAIAEDARRLKDLLPESGGSSGGPSAGGGSGGGTSSKPKSAMILIGPEGDFTPAEIGMAKLYGCLPMTLGPIILRTETAAIYSLSVLAHELF